MSGKLKRDLKYKVLGMLPRALALRILDRTEPSLAPTVLHYAQEVGIEITPEEKLRVGTRMVTLERPVVPERIVLDPDGNEVAEMEQYEAEDTYTEVVQTGNIMRKRTVRVASFNSLPEAEDWVAEAPDVREYLYSMELPTDIADSALPEGWIL